MEKKKTVSKVFALLLTFCLILTIMPVTAMAAEGEEAVFAPKRLFIEGFDERPDETLLEKVSLVGREYAAKGICDTLPIVYGDASLEMEGDIVVQLDTEPAVVQAGQDDSQSYHIDAMDGKVNVRAKSAVGMMYGLRDVMKTLLLGQDVVAKDQDMDVSQRIFHLDCGRKYFSREFIISLIRELSWLEMNQLELDFSNGSGFRFELEDMTLDVNGTQEDISVILGGQTDPDSWLTVEDMDAIIEAANQYGVEIVPCLDTPGHTGWILGQESLSKYAKNKAVNVESEESKAFAKALVKKYAAYFLSRGCTTFHIGGDEFLHSYVGWLEFPASTEYLYPQVADYLDSLAGELKEMGYQKIRSFNDPLYYNGKTDHEWVNIDEAEYWCYNGMNGFRYATPAYLAEKGFHMINGHGDFYDIMADNNWQKPVGDAGTKKTPAGIYAQFQNNAFAQNTQVADEYVYGSTYFLWCDNPAGGTYDNVAYSLYPRLRAASAKMKDEGATGTWEDFAATFTDSAGGFLAEGKVQEDFVLPAEPEIKPAVKKESIASQGLDKIINLIEGLDPEEYTAESWAEVAEALTAAKEALDNNASQKELDKALADLIGAFGRLEYGVQRLHLETALKAADAVLALAENYEDTAALAAAVEAGKAVLEDKTAAQEAVDNAACTVLDELFKMAKKADISSLESLIEAAKGLLEGSYTSGSLSDLRDAVERAEEVVADQNRGDNDIADAYEGLINAVINLKMKGNKAALRAMLLKADEVLADADAYVAATVEGLADTKAAAQAVYDDEDAVQSEVDEAVRSLTLRVAEARLKGDVDGDGKITTDDSAALLRAAAELKMLDADAQASADVNGDGTADTSDAVLILQYAAEKVSVL